jgi:hypothetical protein
LDCAQPAAALKSPQPAAAMATLARKVMCPEKLGDFVAVECAAGCTLEKRQQAARSPRTLRVTASGSIVCIPISFGAYLTSASV